MVIIINKYLFLYVFGYSEFMYKLSVTHCFHIFLIGVNIFLIVEYAAAWARAAAVLYHVVNM